MAIAVAFSRHTHSATPSTTLLINTPWRLAKANAGRRSTGVAGGVLPGDGVSAAAVFTVCLPQVSPGGMVSPAGMAASAAAPMALSHLDDPAHTVARRQDATEHPGCLQEAAVTAQRADSWSWARRAVAARGVVLLQRQPLPALLRLVPSPQVNREQPPCPAEAPAGLAVMLASPCGAESAQQIRLCCTASADRSCSCTWSRSGPRPGRHRAGSSVG